MDTVICNESGCEAVIDPKTMQYGRDFYVLINLTDADEDDLSLQNIIDKQLVGIYCKNCGTVILAEASANGFEVVSRRAT